MSIQTDALHDVVVVGAGPVGLLLAGDLAAAGKRPVVVEKALAATETPKANGVVGRAGMELRRRGVLHGTGQHVIRPPRFRFGPLTLKLGLLRNPLHVLPIPQHRLEELLERRAVAHRATILRGHELVGFEQNDDQVTVRVATADSDVELTARYLVGCDGAHSFVRKQLGIPFPGLTSQSISRLARVTVPASVATRNRHKLTISANVQLALFEPNITEHGSVTIVPVDAFERSARDDLYIVNVHEPLGDTEATDELLDIDLRNSLRRVLGADVPFTSLHAGRSVVANSRHAERYRSGRAFLAGDAAHVFSAGGSALNVGLADAITLAETLAVALRSNTHDAQLDDYQTQRYPAATRALAHTRLQHALEETDATGDALRDVFGELLKDRATARRIAALIEG